MRLVPYTSRHPTKLWVEKKETHNEAHEESHTMIEEFIGNLVIELR